MHVCQCLFKSYFCLFSGANSSDHVYSLSSFVDEFYTWINIAGFKYLLVLHKSNEGVFTHYFTIVLRYFFIRAFAFCWILEVHVNDIDILKENPTWLLIHNLLASHKRSTTSKIINICRLTESHRSLQVPLSKTRPHFFFAYWKSEVLKTTQVTWKVIPHLTLSRIQSASMMALWMIMRILWGSSSSEWLL